MQRNFTQFLVTLFSDSSIVVLVRTPFDCTFEYCMSRMSAALHYHGYWSAAADADESLVACNAMSWLINQLQCIDKPVVGRVQTGGLYVCSSHSGCMCPGRNAISCSLVVRRPPAAVPRSLLLAAMFSSAASVCLRVVTERPGRPDVTTDYIHFTYYYRVTYVLEFINIS